MFEPLQDNCWLILEPLQDNCWFMLESLRNNFWFMLEPLQDNCWLISELLKDNCWFMLEPLQDNCRLMLVASIKNFLKSEVVPRLNYFCLFGWMYQFTSNALSISKLRNQKRLDGGWGPRISAAAAGWR